VVAQLTPEEEGPLVQFCTGAELGPAGIRALCAAILGKGTNMKGGPYKPLKSLRFWRNNARDAGAGAVVRRGVGCQGGGVFGWLARVCLVGAHVA